VRAAIFFGTRGQSHRVLQVTSANSGDGKTTLCCNLAAAIAMSGKSCLLVDGDLRRPRVHRLFGLSLDVGVSSVVRDGMDVPDAIQKTLVPNLDVMTVGPRVDNPAELLLSPQFTDLVQQLREKYDFVLIDTPPILIVTDPAAVAAHVDGVILVVRNTKRSRPQTRRVRETLDLIGARVLGVVVNGISEKAAGYGYGDSYSYNYTTSYRSKSGKYYSEERVGHSYYDESRKRR
jgi:capsular exopolysaccharide synthesis family protein